jgi:putative ABC transport system substrate-binding protein
MDRRDFISLLGGAAAWPTAARAQEQLGRVRQIGLLISGAENDLARRANRAAFQEALAKLGWIEGSNLRIDRRFGVDDPDRFRAYAAELVSLGPDVIVTDSGAATRTMQQHTQTIPIVFTGAGDPVANNLLRNIARPEGNVTGFSAAEPSIAARWVELLKEAAPRLARVAIIFDPELSFTSSNYISSLETAAPVLAVQIVKTPVRNSFEIVRAIDAFALEPNGGLVVLPPSPTPAVRETIFQLAAQHRLPTFFFSRNDVVAGGLMSYATDTADRYRRAAAYVDRLLRGAKVIDLPVQFPTKFELVVNLKTAKAIGLTIPESFLLRADEVIE